MKTGALLSWGRYPRYPQTAHACHWRNDLGTRLVSTAGAFGTTLAYGNGRSYGDSCLAASDHVLYMRRMDRFISASWDKGILSAEAGVTLGEILSLAIPRGWFLPVLPGTKYVTLGGAIANDVHGKNHHLHGTFGRHLRCFGLMRSQDGYQHCSPRDNPALFAATIGGLGLTGIISWAELQLRPIRSSDIDTLTVRFSGLAEFFSLSREIDPDYEFAVAWIDCAARRGETGRGVYSAGNFAQGGGGLSVTSPLRLSIPLQPPFSLVNAASVRLFNAAHWHRHPRRPRFRRVGYDAYLCPLDGIRNWNRLYGPAGFQQYQCLIPEPHAEPAIRELLEAVAGAGEGSFLAVLKRCGNQISPGLMSFPRPGVTLALDFPQRGALERGLLKRLDAIVREAGGHLYPAKDAHMGGEDFRRSYPAWEQVEALRDPALCSRFWQRVTG